MFANGPEAPGGARAAAILARYDAEMRLEPPHGAGTRVERAGDVVRERGAAHNLIAYWTFDAAGAERAVAEQAAYFRGLSESVEWKLYAHDAPSNLAAVLAAHGFEPDETETLMVLALDSTEHAPRVDPGVTVREVSSDSDLATYIGVTTRAFGRDASSSVDALGARIFGAGADTIAYVAYVDGEAAGAGRLELAPGRSFASLWGGGTEPASRHRGVYRSLVAERSARARARGYAYVTVDARETSRPILERLGFFALTTVQGWKLRLD